jgi:hypothetical protein
MDDTTNEETEEGGGWSKTKRTRMEERAKIDIAKCVHEEAE